MKIDRSAFLYLDGTARDFAQCGSCRFGRSKCALMSNIAVSPTDGACGFYIPGAPMVFRDVANLTKEQTGYSERQVRCENCGFFTPSKTCGLYEDLNRWNDEFNLDPDIKPRGCCNAQMPKESA